MQMIVFVGIQATGKTTFYKRLFINSHLRISMDLLHTRHREKCIFDCCIKSRTSIVVDNTNPLKKDRARYIIPAKKALYEIIGYYFKSDLQETLKRNENRDSKEVIPKAGVLGTYNKLELPSIDEGFDKLYYVSIVNTEFQIKDWKIES